MKIRSYKFRIYPNEKQKVLLAKTFGCVRWIYNHCLEIKSSLYQSEKKCISIFNLNKKVTEIKKSEEFQWLNEVSAQALQGSLRNLDAAFTRFFRDKKGYPTFKKKKGLKSFQLPQGTRINFEAGKLHIYKFTEGIKCHFHRKFEGKIKTCTVSQVPSGKYFVSLNVEEEGEELPIQPAKIESCIGIDLGIKTYATLSDGTKVENPKNLEKALKKLRRASRRHSKKKIGSKNHEKARKKLATQYEKVTNKRKDFLHKLTRQLVDNQNHQSFAIENLAIVEMLKSRMARLMKDCAWGTFRHYLEYKARRAGKEVLIIGRFEPSSKMCSCGKINHDLKLSDRFWSCSCGANHDRDILAANNIRNFAFMKQNTKKDSVGRETPKPSRKRKSPSEIRISESLKKES